REAHAQTEHHVPPDRVTPYSHSLCCASTRSLAYLLYGSQIQSTLSRQAVTRRNQRGLIYMPAPRALALATSITYPGTTEHIRIARTDLRAILHECPMADEVILCASELAANAATHSRSRLPGGTFTVRAKISPGAYAWIQVEDDGGPTSPGIRDAAGHHGL